MIVPSGQGRISSEFLAGARRLEFPRPVLPRPAAHPGRWLRSARDAALAASADQAGAGPLGTDLHLRGLANILIHKPTALRLLGRPLRQPLAGVPRAGP